MRISFVQGFATRSNIVEIASGHRLLDEIFNQALDEIPAKSKDSRRAERTIVLFLRRFDIFSFLSFD